MRAKNSTNVRILENLYRMGFRVMGSLAPRWTAAQAERLFRTPPQRPVDQVEQSILAQATRSDIEIEDGEVAVYRWGHRGPRALLVHGWGGAAGQFHPLIQPLLKAGFAVVAFDAPAHGKSSGELSSLPQFAEAILEVADRYGPFDALISHSMGGAAASLAMAQGMKVGRAVYIAPPADAYDWYRKFSKTLGFTSKLEEETRQRMEERIDFDFSTLNAETLGPKVETSLLVIHDHQDKEVAWEEGRRTVENLPHAQLLSTEGLGHRRILRDPDVMRSALAFLQGRSPRTGKLRRDPACSRCGKPLADVSHRGMCEDCELEFELFDPPARRQNRTKPVALAGVRESE